LRGINALITWGMNALGLWFGAWLIAQDMRARSQCNYQTTDSGELIEPDDSCISGGDVMICIFSIFFGSINLGQAAPGFSAFKLARHEVSKAFAKIALVSPIDPLDESKGAALDDVQGSLEFRNVRFAYPMRPDHEVYTGMNLTIPAGKTVAFVGPSGCGKSTAVQLIERFYDPSAGAVLLDGTDIKDLKVSWYRQQIGLVSQEPVLFGGTIRDNISYGKPGASSEDIENAAKLANIHWDIVGKFPDKYDTQVGEGGIQLSGGQKQRIAIARAIVRDPKILLLDEATSALDTKSERVVQEALDGLLKARQRTTIVIAHRLSTIRHADKIVVFTDGRIVEEGTHEELIVVVDSLYATLVNLQGAVLEGEATPAKELCDANLVNDDLQKDTMADGTDSDVMVDGIVDVTLDEEATTNSTNGETGDVEKGTLISKEKTDKEALPSSKEAGQWVWDLSKPMRPLVGLGLLGSMIMGFGFPLLGYFLAEMITIFFNTDTSDMMEGANFWAGMFCVLGAAQFVGNFLQRCCFGITAERLAMHVRDVSFEKILGQDVAWFDRPANTGGNLPRTR